MKLPSHAAYLLLALSLVPSPGRADQNRSVENIVSAIEWSASNTPGGCEMDPKGYSGTPALVIRNTKAERDDVEIWQAKNPPLTTRFYAVTGMLRYEAVQGNGHMLLWNVFGGSGTNATKSTYFSKTLDEAGPASKIIGSSDWRPLIIPFDASKAEAEPVELDLHLVLPSTGAVWLSGLKLVEFDSAESMRKAADPELSRKPSLVPLTVAALILMALRIRQLFRRRKRL